jgi:hypothetical protein
MAKRKKGSKVQGRAKAQPKRTPVKKAVRKSKQPVTPVVETFVVETDEQPVPGVITVTGGGGQIIKRVKPIRRKIK